MISHVEREWCQRGLPLIDCANKRLVDKHWAWRKLLPKLEACERRVVRAAMALCPPPESPWGKWSNDTTLRHTLQVACAALAKIEAEWKEARKQ